MVTTERLTISLPADLLAGIDRYERNRSRFLAEAVVHELERRRREELLRSVRAPHAASEELIALGTGDWLAGLPEEDADLVDADAGTPLTWVPGDGWKAGS